MQDLPEDPVGLIDPWQQGLLPCFALCMHQPMSGHMLHVFASCVFDLAELLFWSVLLKCSLSAIYIYMLLLLQEFQIGLTTSQQGLLPCIAFLHVFLHHHANVWLVGSSCLYIGVSGPCLLVSILCKLLMCASGASVACFSCQSWLAFLIDQSCLACAG